MQAHGMLNDHGGRPMVGVQDPAGKAVIRDLVKHSDVLLENFIPGQKATALIESCSA